MTLRKIATEDEAKGGLENTPIHKILVLFHIPARWPAWKVALGALILIIAVTGIWWLIVGQALTPALILAAFILADAFLLRSLPAKGYSYGPWQSQVLALAILRSVAAGGCSIVAALFGPDRGVIALTTIQFMGSAALIWGAMVEPFRLQLTELQMEIDHLPAGTPPIRILHISDLHVERLTRREDKLLGLVERAQADLILITGDYLNLSYVRDARAQADVKHLLNQLWAPFGVYAVLGSPTVDARDEIPFLFDDLSIRLLRNEWQSLDLGDGRQLVLLGLDCSHYLPTDGRRLHELVAQSPNTVPRVLLYHAPDLMPEASKLGIDLYLCGHTHGGQVRLPLYGAILTSSQLGKRFEMGFYQNDRTNLYVSRGVGLEGLGAPRIRFLSPPEITLVTIRSRD